MLKIQLFSDYQELSQSKAFYPNHLGQGIYPALGLAGEAGEVVEKIKKMHRDGVPVDKWTEFQTSLKRELGDVLWYVCAVGAEFNISLQDIATANIQKLEDREQRNALSGSGDDR